MGTGNEDWFRGPSGGLGSHSNDLVVEGALKKMSHAWGVQLIWPLSFFFFFVDLC